MFQQVNGYGNSENPVFSICSYNRCKRGLLCGGERRQSDLMAIFVLNSLSFFDGNIPVVRIRDGEMHRRCWIGESAVESMSRRPYLSVARLSLFFFAKEAELGWTGSEGKVCLTHKAALNMPKVFPFGEHSVLRRDISDSRSLASQSQKY